MIVRPYIKGDELQFECRDTITWVDDTFAWSVLLDGKIVAVWGVTEYFPGTAHLWSCVSDAVRGKGISFTRKARKMLSATLNQFGFHRVQAFVGADLDENCRWIRLLGLEYEATLHRAMPDGSDLKVYARLL